MRGEFPHISLAGSITAAGLVAWGMLLSACSGGTHSAGGAAARIDCAAKTDGQGGDSGFVSAAVDPPDCLRQLSVYEGPHTYVYSAAWSPVNDYVLSGTDQELRLLHVDTAASTVIKAAAFTDQNRSIWVEWSSDGRFALSAGADLRLLAIATDPPQISELARYSGHGGDIYTVTWSPDGRFALTASKDETVRLLAVDGATSMLEERAIFRGHVGKVLGVAWAPDGKHALSVGEDGTARLLLVDLDTPAIRQLALVVDVDQESAVTWAVPGHPLLTGTWGVCNATQLWSVNTNLGTLALQAQFPGVTIGVDALQWSRDGNRLISGIHDETIRMFAFGGNKLQTTGILGNYTHGVHAVSWSLDGSYLLLAASHIDRVTLLDTRDCSASAE